MGDALWGYTLLACTLLVWWACAVNARNMGVLDHGSSEWDEVVAFWLVLWVLTPASFATQAAAFVLFRFFDAVKPGPVGWADALFHGIDVDTERWPWAKAGWGIMLDDLVAAGCTLLVMAVWRAW
jgi:phosphatidylglycerophosphatase A